MIWFVIGISLFISGCSFRSGVEGKAWFRYASKYDQALMDMAESKGSLKDYYKLCKMEQKFFQAKQPSETEIISVLKSPNREFQKVGLIAMSLKPIETEPLIDILFNFLQVQDIELRWYAIRSLERFTKFPEPRKAELGKQLLEIVKARNDIEISIEEIILLAKFPSKEAAVFLAERLMKEGKEIEGEEGHMRIYRYATFRTLKDMGDSYYCQAEEYVNAHGSSEMKKELLKNEEAFEMVSAQTGK